MSVASPCAMIVGASCPFSLWDSEVMAKYETKREATAATAAASRSAAAAAAGSAGPIAAAAATAGPGAAAAGTSVHVRGGLKHRAGASGTGTTAFRCLCLCPAASFVTSFSLWACSELVAYAGSWGHRGVSWPWKRECGLGVRKEKGKKPIAVRVAAVWRVNLIITDYRARGWCMVRIGK
jgi:hypothetical protein